MKRFILASALAVAAVLRIYSVASAHVTLVSSDPAAGSRTAASPSRIRLEFSEPIEARVSHVTLVSGDGRSTTLAVSSDPRNSYVLLAPVSLPPSGAFRVVWHVVSADGHPVGGNFTFTVGDATAPAPELPAQSRPTAWGPTIAGAPSIPAMLRGLGVGTLAALAGVLFFIVATGAGAEQRPSRFALKLAVAAVLLLGAHLATWAVNAAPDHRVTTEWLTSAFGTTVGRVELYRTSLALLPLWALALVRRPGLALALTLPSLLLSAAVGHSAAFRPMVSIPLKALHLFALAAWLGGLLWLVVREQDDLFQYVREAARVSTVAFAAIIAITISGILQTLVLVPTIAGFKSAYGAIVLLKVAGVLVLAAFGAHHRFRVMPRLAGGGAAPASTQFASSLRREIALMWLVAVLGGFLAYTPPPDMARGSNSPTSESAP